MSFSYTGNLEKPLSTKFRRISAGSVLMSTE